LLAAETDTACTRHAADGEAATFFTHLIAGEVLPALQATLGRSPMMQGRQSDLETLTRQIQTATDIYGPVRSQECVREAGLGSMVLRREYLAQHDKMLTRWTLVFQRLPSGWQTVQVSYEDQVNNWMN
jgi:hypothetical protein